MSVTHKTQRPSGRWVVSVDRSPSVDYVQFARNPSTTPIVEEWEVDLEQSFGNKAAESSGEVNPAL